MVRVNLAGAALLLLGGLLLVQVDRLGHDHILVDTLLLVKGLGGHCKEGRLYTGAILSRGLEVLDIVALVLAPSHGGLLGHGTLLDQVNFVSDEHAIADTSLELELVDPHGKVREGVGLGQIEDQDAGIGATVEGGAKRLETLLSGGIPDLQRDGLSIDLDIFSQEIGTNGGLVTVIELLAHVLVHEGGLSDTTVTEDDDLEKGLLAGHFVCGTCFTLINQ